MVISLRLGGETHMCGEYVDRLLVSVNKYGKCFDEVWIATNYGMLSLDACRENSENMRITAEKFKKSGIIPSMQISRTVGHGDTLLTIFGGEGIKDLELDKVTGIDGAESVAQFCWNNKDFRKYVYDAMNIYASFGPDTVWVDDDLRIRNVGRSRALCFCKNCIRLFNEKYGYKYTRETLRADFLDASLKTRKEFVDFHTASIAELAEIISKAVHDASPKSKMALQNGGNTALAVNAQKAILDVMKNVSGQNTGFRAGGGFYDDHDPEQMLDKAIQVNYLNSRLPEHTTSRSCEIENLPWIAYGKSHECTCLEATLYMAYGCNEASITLMDPNEAIDYHEGHFERIVKYRPYLEALSDNALGTENAGICIYQPKNSHLVYNEDNAETAWNSTSIWGFKKLMRCGIPFHASPRGDAYILSSSACDYIDEADMELLLKSPVVTDATAIEKLTEKGFFDKESVSVLKMPFGNDTAYYEATTSHVINDGIMLDKWLETCFYATEPLYTIDGKDIESVSDYYSYGTNQKTGCANAVITTRYGAKWHVRSANLANGAINHNRRNQFLSAVNYITGKSVAAYVSTPHQIAIIPREDSDKKTVSVTLLNVSITDFEDIEVVIRAPKNTSECILTDPYDADEKIILAQKDGAYAATVKELRAWRTKTLLFR